MKNLKDTLLGAFCIALMIMAMLKALIVDFQSLKNMIEKLMGGF